MVSPLNQFLFQTRKAAEAKRRERATHQPAAGYHPATDMWETRAFALRVARRRRRNQIARLSRRKNR